MIKKMIVVFLMVLLVAVSGAGGYFFAKKQDAARNLEEKQAASLRAKTAILNLDLLHQYINFVFAPQQSVSDPQAFAKILEQKAKLIGDKQLLDKFYQTGDEDGKEQKIVNFLDSLIVNVGDNCKN